MLFQAKRSPQPMSRGFPQRNMSTTSSNGSSEFKGGSAEITVEYNQIHHATVHWKLR